MENFAGLTPPYSDYETAKIVVLPVPYDATSSWVHGAEKGPEKLLEASVQLEWYDTETCTEVYKHGIHTAQPVDEQRSPEHLCAAVEQRVGALFDDAKFPVTIGGNHTVSIGAIRAAAQRYDNLTVLQLDAHSDLRRTYEGSELNHACVMNQAKKVAHITQVGIRSQCIEETDNFEPERIFWARDIYFDHTCQWEKSLRHTDTKRLSDHRPRRVRHRHFSRHRHPGARRTALFSGITLLATAVRTIQRRRMRHCGTLPETQLTRFGLLSGTIGIPTDDLQISAKIIANRYE